MICQRLTTDQERLTNGTRTWYLFIRLLATTIYLFSLTLTNLSLKFRHVKEIELKEFRVNSINQINN